MTEPADNTHSSSRACDDRRRLRWSIYALLIALALGQAAGKILAVNSTNLELVEKRRIEQAVEAFRQRQQENGVEGAALEEVVAKKRAEYEQQLRLQRPFLSANDRSRWMAIRALAEHGDFEIERYFAEPTWDTIDMVQHRGRDGDLHLYSSKPPLLMVLLAGPYWLVIQTTGMTLGTHPYEVGRFLLLVVNGGALLMMLLATASLIERLGIGDLGRIFAMACVSLATLLSAFTPVLNNHLFAAAATACACALWAKLLEETPPRTALSLAAGLATGLAAAFELPALAMTGALFVSLLVHRSGETLRRYLPGVLIVAAAFFATNYWAHATVYPPYAYRNTAEGENNWYKFEYTVADKTRQSYWHNPSSIDRGEASRTNYALHTLVGHHGVFSLTPVWLLSLVGGALLLRQAGIGREFAAIMLIVTAICLVFYIGYRPQPDRNYGGMTSGFRWLFWLAPAWAAMTPPAVELLKRFKVGWGFCLMLLALSIMSASYPTWNPWSQPWLYRWFDYLGFVLI